jgi:hypothetical protein
MEAEAQQVEQLKNDVQARRDHVPSDLDVWARAGPEEKHEDATQREPVHEQASTRE